MDYKEPFAPLGHCEDAARNGIELGSFKNDNFGESKLPDLTPDIGGAVLLGADIANRRFLYRNKVYVLMGGIFDDKPQGMVLRCFLLKPTEVLKYECEPNGTCSITETSLP